MTTESWDSSESPMFMSEHERFEAGNLPRDIITPMGIRAMQLYGLEDTSLFDIEQEDDNK